MYSNKFTVLAFCVYSQFGKRIEWWWNTNQVRQGQVPRLGPECALQSALRQHKPAGARV